MAPIIDFGRNGPKSVEPAELDPIGRLPSPVKERRTVKLGFDRDRWVWSDRRRK
jgi:hypothetical protein